MKTHRIAQIIAALLLTSLTNGCGRHGKLPQSEQTNSSSNILLPIACTSRVDNGSSSSLYKPATNEANADEYADAASVSNMLSLMNDSEEPSNRLVYLAQAVRTVLGVDALSYLTNDYHTMATDKDVAVKLLDPNTPFATNDIPLLSLVPPNTLYDLAKTIMMAENLSPGLMYADQRLSDILAFLADVPLSDDRKVSVFLALASNPGNPSNAQYIDGAISKSESIRSTDPILYSDVQNHSVSYYLRTKQYTKVLTAVDNGLSIVDSLPEKRRASTRASYTEYRIITYARMGQIDTAMRILAEASKMKDLPDEYKSYFASKSFFDTVKDGARRYSLTSSSELK